MLNGGATPTKPPPHVLVLPSTFVFSCANDSIWFTVKSERWSATKHPLWNVLVKKSLMLKLTSTSSLDVDAPTDGFAVDCRWATLNIIWVPLSAPQHEKNPALTFELW